MGAHLGMALFREGDYLGTTVNVAPAWWPKPSGEFLVACGPTRMHPRWTGLGRRPGFEVPEGVADPVELFSIEPVEPAAGRPIDPVCGMELDPDSTDHRSNGRGDDMYFCSQACLDLFAANPSRYEQALWRLTGWDLGLWSSSPEMRGPWARVRS